MQFSVALSPSIVLFWATSSCVAVRNLCAERETNFGEQSLYLVRVTECWLQGWMEEMQQSAPWLRTLHLKASLCKCNFFFIRFFSMFRRTPKIKTSHPFCINFLTPVGNNCFDWAEASPSILFEAAIWLSFVTVCPLCPPVQFGKNDDTVSDALCRIYALPWQCWFIYLSGCLAGTFEH